MATSRISSKTRKGLKLVKRARLARIKKARGNYEDYLHWVNLLKELQGIKGLSTDAFYGRVPMKLVQDATNFFDRMDKSHQTKYALKNMGGFYEVTFSRRERLKNFIFTDYLKGIQIFSPQKYELSVVSGSKPLGWPRGLILRGQFNRDLMNNFPAVFMRWKKNSPHSFNSKFSKYGVTMEELRSRYPNLMKRLVSLCRRKDYSMKPLTRAQLDDFYKIYRELRGTYKISNRQIFA